MMKDQDFPISIEVQLLGGLSDGKPRSTANLCTPGTNVVYNGKLHTPHCTNSTSKTYDGDQWVRVEVLVHGDELVRHIVEGQTVLEYPKPQIGGGAVEPVDPAVKIDGTPLTDGFISIQAETAPADFRKIELLNLEGCMDPKASNYQGLLREVESGDVHVSATGDRLRATGLRRSTSQSISSVTSGCPVDCLQDEAGDTFLLRAGGAAGDRSHRRDAG